MQINQNQRYQPQFGMALRKPNAEVKALLSKIFGANVDQAQEFADTFQKVAKQQENNKMVDVEIFASKCTYSDNKTELFPKVYILNKISGGVVKEFNGSENYPKSISEALEAANQAADVAAEDAIAKQTVKEIIDNL